MSSVGRALLRVGVTGCPGNVPMEQTNVWLLNPSPCGVSVWESRDIPYSLRYPSISQRAKRGWGLSIPARFTGKIKPSSDIWTLLLALLPVLCFPGAAGFRSWVMLFLIANMEQGRVVGETDLCALVPHSGLAAKLRKCRKISSQHVGISEWK